MQPRGSPNATSMDTSPEISICTRQDFDQILEDLPEFWDGRDTRHLHHPFLIHEFGNTAFVIRDGSRVVAYLLGFISQTQLVGYVHTLAVRASARRRHLAHQLFDHFIECARRHGCRHIKAITTPSNLGSIAFHKSLGMHLLGEPNSEGISVVPDYAGRAAPRVVFWKDI
jgi:ribosomal protein S18 acetylase RimI-like enzyme